MVLNYQFYHHQRIHSNVISGGSSTVIKKAVENGRDVVRAGNRSWYTMYIRGMFCPLLSGLHPLRWSLTDLLEVFFANCLKLGCFTGYLRQVHHPGYLHTTVSKTRRGFEVELIRRLRHMLFFAI